MACSVHTGSDILLCARESKWIALHQPIIFCFSCVDIFYFQDKPGVAYNEGASNNKAGQGLCDGLRSACLHYRSIFYYTSALLLLYNAIH